MKDNDAASLGVTLTKLDDPLFDRAGATKRDLINYLESVADRIIPELADRALSVIRVHRGQEAFMQKDPPSLVYASLGAAGDDVGGVVEAGCDLRALQRQPNAAVVRQHRRAPGPARRVARRTPPFQSAVDGSPDAPRRSTLAHQPAHGGTGRVDHRRCENSTEFTPLRGT